MRVAQRSGARHLGVLALFLSAAFVGAGARTSAAREKEDDDGLRAVFTLTNEKEGNELAVFARDSKGNLSKPVFVPTGGTGTGAGLGNQGALALGEDGEYLYAVNPGSDSITVFRLGTRARPVQVVPSGGVRPVSVAVSGNLLYVLNAGGATAGGEDTVVGFTVGENGRLRPLANSARRLSAANTAAAQVGFNRDGNVLTVTERATNTITLFSLDDKGRATDRALVASRGRTPFGFAYTRDDLLVVAEAGANTVSSYRLDDEAGTLTPVSASVPTDQGATCWLTTTRNGQYAYTGNTGGRTVTGFKVSEQGRLTILNADGVTARAGTTTTDVIVLGNRTLYVLNSGDGTVGAYDIGAGGALTARQTATGLPLTRPTGLVVR